MLCQRLHRLSVNFRVGTPISIRLHRLSSFGACLGPLERQASGQGDLMCRCAVVRKKTYHIFQLGQQFELAPEQLKETIDNRPFGRHNNKHRAR